MSATTTTDPLSARSSAILDGLRGLAAQAVCVGHGVGYILDGAQPTLASLPTTAVSVFFCLSGFVITYSCTVKSATGYGLPDYLLDRFSRIFIVFAPAILLAYFVGLAIGQFGLASGVSRAAFDLFAALTMIGNPAPLNAINVRPPFSEIYGPGWTVMVEWWIYVTFGLLFLARRRNLVWLLSLVLAGFTPVVYLVDPSLYAMTAMWAGGAFAFLAFRLMRLHPIAPDMLRSLIVVLFVLAVVRFRIFGPVYDLVFALLFSALLACTLSHSENNPAPARLSQWLRVARFSGQYSYSLYMVHFTLVSVLLRPPFASSPIGGKGPWSFVCYIVLANACAIAFYFVFERRTPILRRRLSSVFLGRQGQQANLRRD